MEIALIADDNKKELMAQFCIAYSGILSRHHLCATQHTGSYIADGTGLQIETFLSDRDGTEQITSRIAYDEIDLVFFFRTTDPDADTHAAELDLLRKCDMYNIPVATNIATAEVLVMALDKGSLDWRQFLNPKSDYNRKKRA